MDNKNDAIFSALSDPTRRDVIERLAQGPCTVSELHDPAYMALPSFLKHLKKLEDAGLVTTQKSGRVRTAELRREALDAPMDWLSQQQRQWSARLDRLAVLAAQMAQDTTDNRGDPDHET